MDPNSPQLWDKVWMRDSALAEECDALSQEEKGIRWQRLEAVVIREFGSFEGLHVVEIGAGTGTNAALAAQRGALVTVLDYSEGALDRAKGLFERAGLQAEFVRQDALSLPAELLGRFDVSMSFGLAEHFTGADRITINRAHLDVLREGGIAFISVPNRHNVPYRIWMSAAKLMGTWVVGEEYPYSRKELADICRALGVADYAFFGDSLPGSLQFLNPLRQIRWLRDRFGTLSGRSISKAKPEAGTALDQYFAYALVLCAKKAGRFSENRPCTSS